MAHRTRTHDVPAQPQPQSQSPDGPRPSGRQVAVRALLALVLLYLFLVAVGVLEDGIAQMGEGFGDAVLEGVSHPLSGLFAGVLATILVQSSSVTTSTIVGLVATGVVPVETAVPMVMGANIGTTVTNTIVTMVSMRRRDEFRQVVAAATMHDLFNFLAVLVLLPLELLTGFLSSAARWLAGVVADTGITGVETTSPLAMATDPANAAVETVLSALVPAGAGLGTVMLVLGVLALYVTIRYLSKNMRAVIAGPLQEKANRSVGRAGGLVGIAVGTVAAILVVSSSIVTVTLLPLVAAGALTVRNAYPITLGANLGTTVTALLAALATGQPEGLVIALVHVLFNVTAVTLIYPLPRIRYLPVRLAEGLGALAARRRWVVPVYTGGVFVALPVAAVAAG
ncbi:Na/Pi symporter [Kineococcus sp. SYSU DK018]|uniref:Na/Pi symporter n=1 Tax=Kineococcus sp. SYSU DK018 TaxID=3383139 RepID=UPI003D7C9960